MTDYVALLKAARAHVEASVLYKRFISGTPLENDIAVWMADFASEQDIAITADDCLLLSSIVSDVASDAEESAEADVRAEVPMLRALSIRLAKLVPVGYVPKYEQENLPEAAAAVLRENVWALITDADPADVATIVDVQTQYTRLQEWYATLHREHVVALAENERLRASAREVAELNQPNLEQIMALSVENTELRAERDAFKERLAHKTRAEEVARGELQARRQVRE
jgi:hypothetical protein